MYYLNTKFDDIFFLIVRSVHTKIVREKIMLQVDLTKCRTFFIDSTKLHYYSIKFFNMPIIPIGHGDQ